MIVLLLLLLPLSVSMALVPDKNQGFRRGVLYDRRYLLDELGDHKSPWTEEQMKMYKQGVEDNVTVVTFSIKVFYSIEVGLKTGGKIASMVDVMIENMNKRFKNLGALTRAKLHCLEQTTWTEDDGIPTTTEDEIPEGSNSRNSADAIVFIVDNIKSGGYASYGSHGLWYNFRWFDKKLWSVVRLDRVISGIVTVHEIGHSLGLRHGEMKKEAYYSRVFKEFRFALAAVGDESEACPKEEADWEFRSKCFKNSGNYRGDELSNEGRTSEKSAKACQARCAATEGCSFFSFKEVKAGCHLSTKDAQLTYAEGVVGGPVHCNPGWFIRLFFIV